MFAVAAAFGPTVFRIGGISVAAVTASNGFALTANPFFKRQKGTKRALPRRSAPRWGSGFLRYGIAPGAAATVCFAAPTSAVYDCVVRSLRSHTRIDPFTQPAEGAKDQKPDQEPDQNQKPGQNQKPLTLALSRRERELTVADVRITPTCISWSYSGFEPPTNRLPPQRKKELTVVDVRDTLTWDIESNPALEKHTDRLPLPGERAGVRGEYTANPKPCAASHHSIGRVSARLLLILIHRRRRKAEWRD